jgi:nucleotide-binding universal stress UspA family protein
VPCLFVPQKLAGWSRILASVDGTDRGLSVLVAACDFAQALGGRLRILTVEPIRSDEKVPGTAHLPDARSTRLAQALERLRRVQPDPWENWEKAPGADRSDLLVVRRGNPAAEILAEVSRCAPDVLVFGFRRGGPPGLVEGKSVGRRLAHGAPCATLTIPL